MTLKLKEYHAYINRIGTVVVVHKSPNPPDNDYPFTCDKGFFYNEDGKVYKGRESDFDLVEETILYDSIEESFSGEKDDETVPYSPKMIKGHRVENDHYLEWPPQKNKKAVENLKRMREKKDVKSIEDFEAGKPNI